MKSAILLLFVCGSAQATFTDDFNRPDEILDASDDWTATEALRDRLEVDNNRVESNGALLDSSQLYLPPDQGSANHYVQADWLGSNDGVDYLALRAEGIDDFIGVTGGDLSLLRFRIVEAGTITTWATASSTGAVCVRIEAENATIRFYTATASCTTSPAMTLQHTQVNVTTFQSETSAGLRSQAAGGVDGVALWDNFEHGQIVPRSKLLCFFRSFRASCLSRRSW